jgi:hypothetical protein
MVAFLRRNHIGVTGEIDARPSKQNRKEAHEYGNDKRFDF